jgi:hypothetical protein
MVAMQCAEVMEIGGTLDVFYAGNVLLAEAGSSDPGYAVEVVSPVATIRSWPGLCIRAEHSYRQVRGLIDTLIITGTDTPDDALHDAGLIAWLKQTTVRMRRLVGARELFAAMQPYLAPAVYVNSLGGPDDGDPVREAFGDNYERLAAIKRAYDPENFFRANQNVT